MKYYVILTGSKNNAGDFLIKHRAKQLFKSERPDRKIIDFNAWEKLDDQKLDIVNNSEALILMGGPALQYDMWPGIYKLTDDLNEIKVPIILMGIGWKSKSGSFLDTYDYPFNKTSMQLLTKVEESGYLSSVRDFHTLSTLHNYGFNNLLMTGCPAYYDYDYLNKDHALQSSELDKIAFSLGVSFISSPNAERMMKQNILKCRDYFNEQDFTVVFHHSLNKKRFLQTHGNKKHINAHLKFVEWLKQVDIKYIDISGSAENLIDFYSRMDLHIGYRVHAHIFMNSISKPSILITEDGRGKAIPYVIGGIVLNGITGVKDSTLSKVYNKLNIMDKHSINPHIDKEIIKNIEYEKETNFNRIRTSRKIIDENHKLMKRFLHQLP